MSPLLTFTFLYLIWMANCDNFSLSGKTREVTSVSGNVGQLPCSIGSLDDVAMVLWFKGSSGSPIYSYDARNEKEEPRHLTLKNEWGLRLYFRIWPNLRRSPALFIRDVQPSDAGVYRCRVDYRTSPTNNSVIRLKVIEPPTHLEIRDTSPSRRPISDQQMVPAVGPSSGSHSDITYMGPYTEGQNVTIACSAFGGKPLPEVKWFKNGVVIDTTYQIARGGSSKPKAINELKLFSLSAEHTTSLYTCQATNNNESRPISHSVNLDVYLGVKEVDLEVPDEMTAGNNYSISCTSSGAYPSVRMEFWKMQKRIGTQYQSRSDVDNVTVYKLAYTPETNDDEMTISCKAENPWLNDATPMVARRSLKIKYTPIAILRFGQNKTTNFTEGDSVLMECHVKANPPVYSIMWFHGNDQLYSNESAGIRITGMTLLLTNLKSNYGGKYFCQAVNEVGKGKSNPLVIPLHIWPKCNNIGGFKIVMNIGDSHNLSCNILAWPGDLNFHWTLNGSHEIIPILNASLYNKVYHQNLAGEDLAELGEDYMFPVTKLDYDSLALGFDQGSGSGNAPLSQLDKDLLEEGFIPSVNGTVRQMSQTKSFNKSGIEREESNKMRHPLYPKSEGKEKKNFQLKYSDKVNSYQQLGSPDGSKGVTAEEIESPYGRWKPPQDNPDNIHHEAVLWYTIRTIDDYGTVACWAENSYGKQLHPCLFHIISKHEANQDEANGPAFSSSSRGGKRVVGDGTSSSSLSDMNDARRIPTATTDSQQSLTPPHSPPPSQDRGIHRGLPPSKLQTTLGIILVALLIFIASLVGLFLSFLLLHVRRTRQIERMVMANNKPGNGGQPQTDINQKCVSTTFTSLSSLVSTTSPEETTKNAISLGIYSAPPSICSSSGYGGGEGESRGGGGGGESECHYSNSTSTNTIVSVLNDFPPPPTSIISTSTSHGYGSIEEEEDEDFYRESRPFPHDE